MMNSNFLSVLIFIIAWSCTLFVGTPLYAQQSGQSGESIPELKLNPETNLPSTTPEVPYAGEVPLVPNVRPVIVLQGSDYEMGYQHSQQLVQIFGKYYLEGAATVQRDSENISLNMKSEDYMKQYTPWAIDYIKGMTDGAIDAGIPMTYIQMLGFMTSTESSQPAFNPTVSQSGLYMEEGEQYAFEQPVEDPLGDCSGWAAWGSATKDGNLIAVGNGDHEIRVGSKYRYRHEVNIMVYPETGNNYFWTPPSGGSGHPGMNNKGVVNVHHGTTGYYDRYKHPGIDDSHEGVPRPFLLMHALRFANSAEEAKEISVSIPDPGGRQGGMWADVTGNAFVIENKSFADEDKENPVIIRRPGDFGERDFLYATNNLFSEELKDAWDVPPEHDLKFFPHVGYLGTQGSIGSIGRNLAFWNLFHNYHGEVDLEFAKMMYRFDGPPLTPEPYETIEEAVEDYEKSQAVHWNAHFAEPGNSSAIITQPDDGNDGTFYVSHGPAGRLFSPTYPGAIVVRLNPTYSFFELKLASNPTNVANEARTRARYDLWNAWKALMDYDYSDTEYAPLSEKLNEAVTEWQKGWFYTEEANETSGNESVIKTAQAIRAYTRAQSYARQVYNVINPPAKRPEDLNLRAWHGDWGEWTTRKDGVVVDQ